MKKLFVLFVAVCFSGCLTAQTVNTSMIDFAKTQYPGYLVNVSNASVDMVDAAFRDLLENKYALKSSKESGFRAYLNQPFSPFGGENFDIYYAVSEFGKKNNKTTQLSLIVCTGNMNAVTPSNKPETDAAIKKFLSDFAPQVEAFALKQQANALKEKISKLNSEKDSYAKDIDKTNKQIDKLKGNIEDLQKKISDKDKEIQSVQDALNDLEKKMR